MLRRVVWLLLVTACASGTPATKDPETPAESSSDEARPEDKEASKDDAPKAMDLVLNEAPCTDNAHSPEAIGSAPAGGKDLTCLQVINDQPVPRVEVAYAAIPMPRSEKVYDPKTLAVIDADGAVVAAQFEAVARWGGVVSDRQRPLRWVEVSIPVHIEPNATQGFKLRKYRTAPKKDSKLKVDRSQGKVRVRTGAATFMIDTKSPAFFSSVKVGATQVSKKKKGAGPQVTLDDGKVINRAKVQAFEIIKNGPVKAVIMQRGSFITPTKLRCKHAGGYDPLGYTLVATFYRGQAHADLHFELRNECSDADLPPWTDDALVLREASFFLPTKIGAKQLVWAADEVQTTAPSGEVMVEQRHGAGNPWVRRARVRQGGQDLFEGEAVTRPIAGISDGELVATVQMPWMQYREPQAVHASKAGLRASFISSPLTVGEARGIWNIVRFDFVKQSQLLQAKLQNEVALSRGLLVRAPRDWVNKSGVFPTFGTDGEGDIKTAYVKMMTRLHDQTFDAQWPRAKPFGSQLWPDILRDPLENDFPGEHLAKMNYWNPSRNELLEYLRTGDPKWAWDFAVPQTWTQFFSAYTNIGERTHGIRNGLAMTSGGEGSIEGACRPTPDDPIPEGEKYYRDCVGHWHRSGQGSDDYTYTHGDLAYVVRPSYGLLRRFAEAGKTVVRRYTTKGRAKDVSDRRINRQQVQHYVLLANCAEFVPGSEGRACHDRLKEILTELAKDNMGAGVFCMAERPSTTCLVEQQFMQNALHLPFFHRILRNYGDISKRLKRAIVGSAWSSYVHGMGLPLDVRPKNRKGERPGLVYLINNRDEPTWTNQMQFKLTKNKKAIASCEVAGVNGELWAFGQKDACETRTKQTKCALHPVTDPGRLCDSEDQMLFPNRPHTVATLLMAHQLDPSLRFCEVSKKALSNPQFLDYWEDYAKVNMGWIKGTAQMMQSMVFGVGAADVCKD